MTHPVNDEDGGTHNLTQNMLLAGSGPDENYYYF